MQKINFYFIPCDVRIDEIRQSQHPGRLGADVLAHYVSRQAREYSNGSEGSCKADHTWQAHRGSRRCEVQIHFKLLEQIVQR